jgi:hypothetical protein
MAGFLSVLGVETALALGQQLLAGLRAGLAVCLVSFLVAAVQVLQFPRTGAVPLVQLLGDVRRIAAGLAGRPAAHHSPDAAGA